MCLIDSKSGTASNKYNSEGLDLSLFDLVLCSIVEFSRSTAVYVDCVIRLFW